MTAENDHIWFDEQIAAYLSRGLEGEDLSRFESHRDACASCAAKLQGAKDDDARLQALFTNVAPSSSFEDRMIQGLRTGTRHRTLKFPALHPAVRKAAIGVAAVLALGTFGYVASDLMESGHMPRLFADAEAAKRMKVASNLRQLGQAIQLYANENKGSYPAARWDFSGGANTSLNWSTWKENPGAGENDRLSKSQLGPSADKQPNRDGQNVLYGDGHATFNQNPFVSKQGASIYTRRTPGPADFGGEPKLQQMQQQGGQQGQQQQAHSYYAVIGKDAGGSSDEHAAVRGTVTGQAVTPDARSQPQSQDAITNGKTATFDVKEMGRYFAKGDTGDVAGAKPAPPAQTPPPAEAQANQQAQAAQPDAPKPEATTQASDRKVIRNGTLEFEIDSFDNAVVTVSKIVREEGGFIGTTTSEKLPNGKVKGSITLRVPPDHLDTLVLKLRALGDLKRQNLTADDVTKAYNDLQSELRAAQAMQERLLDLIKNGKGAIKDLLAAEKELGTWREKIEKVQGEINYYNNLVAMATLNLSLFERDIRQAAEVKQTEDVQMGVETEDVEASRANALKAIEDAKGRIIESELKKFEAGQFAAKIVADIAPDQAGPVIDRLKQLGKVARLEIQRKQTSPSDVVVKNGLKVERGETRLNLSLYNLANVAPRQTVNLNLASDDVEKSYNAILARIEKAGGRVISSNLNRTKPDQTTGTIQFETKSADAEAVQQDVRAQGEAMKMTVTDNPDTANITTTKRGFSVQIVSTAMAAAREAATMSIAAPDVPTSYRAILDAARELNLRITESQMNQTDPQNVSATLTVELKRDQQAEFEKTLSAQGQLINRNVIRSTDNENTLDSKLRWQVALMDAERIPPRQSTGVTIEMSDVEQGLAQVTAAVEAASGRVADAGVSKDVSGNSTARARIEVPLSKAGAVIDAIRSQGKVREIQTSKNMQSPDGPLARATIDLTLTSGQQIVGADNGLWATIRNGLATSVSGLLWSLQLIIIGLCLVAPWVLLLWAGWKIVRRKKAATPTPAAA
jgi:glycine cleavage system regulatory protein